jgi:hypothetical protein
LHRQHVVFPFCFLVDEVLQLFRFSLDRLTSFF